MTNDTRLNSLETYIGLLEATGQANTPGAKRSYETAYRLTRICQGESAFVQHCARQMR